MFFPVNGDPYYSNASLLLPMTGANNSTTFTDVSPTPKTITLYGDTKILTAQSKWGQGAGYFDGTGDYLSAATGVYFNFGADSFTIEFYMYPTQVSAGAVVLDFRSANSPFGIVCTQPGASPNKVRFACGDSNLLVYESDITSTDTLSINTWVHVALVRNGSTFLIFLSGQSSGTATWSGSIVNNTTGLLIGALVGGASPYYSGYLQDLRITKGIARYTADFAPPSGPLPYRSPEMPVRSPIIQPSFHQIARLGL